MNILHETGDFSTTIHDDQRDVFIEESARLFDAEYSDQYQSLGELFDSEDRGARYRAATTVKALQKVAAHVENLKTMMGESVVQSSLGPLNQRVYDVVRVFYPNLIAHELCDIQSLDGQTGEIFTIKPVYSDTAGITFRDNFNNTVDADDVELWKHRPDGFYTDRTAAQDSPLGRFTLTYANTTATADANINVGTLPGVTATTGTRVPNGGDGRSWLPIRPGTVQVTLGVHTTSSGAESTTITGVRFTDNGSGALLLSSGHAGLRASGSGGPQPQPATINYATGEIRIHLVAAAALTTAQDFRVSATFETASSREIDSKIREQDNIREDGTLPRRVSFNLTNTPIKARLFPLRFDYNITAGIAAEQHLAINVADQLVEMAAQEVKVERDHRLIAQILAATDYHYGSTDADGTGEVHYAPGSHRTLEADDLVSASGNDGVLGPSWDARNPAGYSLGAKFNEFSNVIDTAESYIQSNNGRGGVDWIICGRNVGNVVKEIKGYQTTGQKAPIGPYVQGYLRDGTMSVIRSISMDPNDFVIGFKGYQAGDAAIILAEWIPLYITPPFNSPELEVHQGLATAYELLTNNAGYFVKGRIAGYGIQA